MKKNKDVVTESTSVVMNVPRMIAAVVPANNQVLIERIKEVALSPTSVLLTDEANKKDSQQAYVLDIGPSVAPNLGFKVGDRVMVAGSYFPVDGILSKNGRSLNMILPDMIKCVLVEE